MLFCGIDIGTTNLKVSLVDGRGQSLWTRSVPTPRLGRAERFAADPQALMAGIEALMTDGWRAVARGRPLAAIATTGVGEDGLCVDAALRPLMPAFPWYDDGPMPEAALLRTDPAATWRAGIEMEYTRTAARWLWLARHRPEIRRETAFWLALTDYPAALWAERPFMSQTLAGRTGAYDIAARDWLGDLLAASQAPPLPPVLQAGTVVGPVRAASLLRSGVADARTQIVAGGHDHPIAASWIQRIDARARVDSIGTANVVYAEMETDPPALFDPLIAFMVPVRARTGTGCLGVIQFSAAVRNLEAEGTNMRAFLALERMPGEPGETQGPRHVLEMAGLKAWRMMERMTGYGVKPAPIYATGGWSRSDSLVELRASMFGEPITILGEQEPAVVGAALLAAEGIGETMTPAEGHVLRVIEPDPAWAARYRAMNEESRPSSS